MPLLSRDYYPSDCLKILQTSASTLGSRGGWKIPVNGDAAVALWDLLSAASGRFALQKLDSGVCAIEVHHAIWGKLALRTAAPSATSVCAWLQVYGGELLVRTLTLTDACVSEQASWCAGARQEIVRFDASRCDAIPDGAAPGLGIDFSHTVSPSGVSLPKGPAVMPHDIGVIRGPVA